MQRVLRAALAVIILLGAHAVHAEDDAGFEPIFDGQSLDGWLGQDMSFWSVEDGAITGTITPEHAPPMNQYLVYQGGLVDNFELKLDFRLTGSSTPNTNGGFQFRSRRTPNGDVAGYQVDNNFGRPWKVRLYDEFGRHDLALEGEQARFDADGQRHVEPLALAEGARDFRLDEWHAYHLVANGRNLSLRINGKLVATCTDDDPQQFEPAGVLAMQLHTGPPMKAQFRDLRLKRLPRSQVLSPREELLATAALDWQLGERTSAHQPPLAAHGKITPGVNAMAGGSRPGELTAHFENGWFDAGRDWNTSTAAITVYLRAQVPDGNWSQPLFGKASGERVNFRLFGEEMPDAEGLHVGFAIRTADGLFQATFPVSEIDAAAWHDLVGRYDGQTLEIFCDGRPMARTDASGLLVPNGEAMLIGGAPEGEAVQGFTGSMTRAALWTRALSDEELAVLARSGS